CSTFFFFSSRRRHTRWPRDWSSDVCSSDLTVSPAFTCSATVPPHPRSSSSGWAAITSTRLGTRALLRRSEMAFRDHLVRRGVVACLRPLDGPRKEVWKETGPVGEPEGVAQSRR